MLSEILVDSENFPIADKTWGRKIVHALAWWHEKRGGLPATVVRSYGKVTASNVARALEIIGFERRTIDAMEVGATIRRLVDDTGIPVEHTHVKDGEDIAEKLLLAELSVRLLNDLAVENHILMASGDHRVVDFVAAENSGWYHFVLPPSSRLSMGFGTQDGQVLRQEDWTAGDEARRLAPDRPRFDDRGKQTPSQVQQLDREPLPA